MFCHDLRRGQCRDCEKVVEVELVQAHARSFSFTRKNNLLFLGCSVQLAGGSLAFGVSANISSPESSSQLPEGGCIRAGVLRAGFQVQVA